MNIIHGIVGVITAPVAMAYGEYRKWQLADRMADETRAAIGDAIARARTHYGPKVEGHLNQLAAYGKLTIITIGSYAVSTIAMLPQFAGGCFLQKSSSVSCRAADYIATAASCYSFFSICILGGKGALDAYRYCKGKEASESGVGGANQARNSDPLQKEKAVITASLKLEKAHRQRLIYQYERLTKLAREHSSAFSLDLWGMASNAAKGFDPSLYAGTTPYDEEISLLISELYRSRIKIEALEEQLAAG